MGWWISIIFPHYYPHFVRAAAAAHQQSVMMCFVYLSLVWPLKYQITSSSHTRSNELEEGREGGERRLNAKHDDAGPEVVSKSPKSKNLKVILVLIYPKQDHE